MKPIEANKKGNENKVYSNLYPDVEVQKPSISYLNVGDLVWINKSNAVSDRECLPNYVSGVFQIVAVKHTTLIAYELSNKTGEVIIGVSYEKELESFQQKISFYKRIL